MSKQIEVGLRSGGTVEVQGDEWFVQPNGRLDVLDTNADQRVTATFATGSWVSVQRAEPKQCDNGMTVGSLKVDIAPTLLGRVADEIDYMCNQARADQADDNGRSDEHMVVSVADLASLSRLIRRELAAKA